MWWLKLAFWLCARLIVTASSKLFPPVLYIFPFQLSSYFYASLFLWGKTRPRIKLEEKRITHLVLKPDRVSYRKVTKVHLLIEPVELQQVCIWPCDYNHVIVLYRPLCFTYTATNCRYQARLLPSSGPIYKKGWGEQELSPEKESGTHLALYTSSQQIGMSNDDAWGGIRQKP